jgi:protein N-terminal glutamine amidohydrolase
MQRLERERFDYVPYFCEENVWRLLQRPELGGMLAWAVIVSNRSKHVVLMRQRGGRAVDGLIHWDYHVFVLAQDPKYGMLVLDLDSTLPFPCTAKRYLEDSFPGDLPRDKEPRFRFMPARYYIEHLASDRSHMKRPDGSWLAPQPPWNRIGVSDGKPSNLIHWISAINREPGRLMDVKELTKIVSGFVRPPLEGSYNNI